jgi:hypothetical protein
MSRTTIPKADYATILREVDADKIPIPAIANRYGVVARTIYIVLGKARAAAAAEGIPSLAADAASLPAAVMETGQEATVLVEAVPDLLRQAVLEALADEETATASACLPRTEGEPAAAAAPTGVQDHPAPVRMATAESRRREDVVQPLAKQVRPATGAVVPRLKSAYGLVVRSEESEETVVPYRSLDELLASIRPVLRETARQGGETWCAIREIDPATLNEMLQAG